MGRPVPDADGICCHYVAEHGTWVVSEHGTWVCGMYASEAAARLAPKAPVDALAKAWVEARPRPLTLEEVEKLMPPEPRQVHVLCQNDFPHSVYFDFEQAAEEAVRLSQEDAAKCDGQRRIFYHVNTVPLVEGSDP